MKMCFQRWATVLRLRLPLMNARHCAGERAGEKKLFKSFGGALNAGFRRIRCTCKILSTWRRSTDDDCAFLK